MRRAVVMAVAAIACIASVSRSEDQPAGGQPPAVLFVFDASGSMMKPVQGKPKIEVARSVMNGVVKSLAPDVKVGLLSFGHRRKGDCSDIEVLAPIGDDRAAVLGAVDHLKAMGETPLTDAIRLAAQQFQGYEGQSSVVVISDGKEECKGDPCAAAREAVAAGVHLRIHVVGFDVTPDEAKQLQCVAKEGKGKYFTATSSTELTKALAEVQKEVAAPVPTPAPQKVQPTAAPSNVLPRGGQGAADAVALKPGDYTMNWSLPANVYEFWKLPVRAGQEIRVVLRPAMNQYTGGTLYAIEGDELVTKGCDSHAVTLPWLASSQQASRDIVVAVGGCNGVASGSGVAVSVRDRKSVV